MMMRHLPLVLLLCGCGLEIDPDTLVRELRILGGRVGTAAPGSIADLDATTDRINLSTLIATPTGPGRRVLAPRSLVVDWYFCLTTRSLVVPGVLDPTCAKFGPADAPPAKNEALLLLGRGESLDVPLGPLREELLRRLLPLLTGMGAGGMGVPTGTIALQLPIVLRAQVAGSSDPLDGETAFLFARLLFTPQGQTAPPLNRNPILRGLWANAEEPKANEAPSGAPLMPCPDSGACVPYSLRRGDIVYLTPLSEPGSAEEYRPLDESGRDKATEKLRYSWFSTDGEFSEARTGGSTSTSKWENEGDFAAPAAVKTVQVYIIVQDERGGADWSRYELQFLD